MGEAHAYVFSDDEADATRFVQSIANRTSTHGALAHSGPYGYPAAPIEYVERTRTEGSPGETKYDWVRRLHGGQLDLFIEDRSAQKVYCRSIVLRTRSDIDLSNFVSADGVPHGVVLRIEERESKEGGKTPFSYDPAQDYVTEL